MGKITRKRHTVEFKAKVALEAMRDGQTLAGLGAKYGIHQAMIAEQGGDRFGNSHMTVRRRVKLAKISPLDHGRVQYGQGDLAADRGAGGCRRSRCAGRHVFQSAGMEPRRPQYPRPADIGENQHPTAAFCSLSDWTPVARQTGRSRRTPGMKPEPDKNRFGNPDYIKSRHALNRPKLSHPGAFAAENHVFYVGTDISCH